MAKLERETKDAVAELMSGQYGAAHRRQLRAAGMTADQIDGYVRRALWKPLQREVYAPAGMPPSEAMREMAAVLAVRHAARKAGVDRRVAVAGRSAARLWKMSLTEVDADSDAVRDVEVVIPFEDAPPELDGVVVHRGRRWAKRRFVTISGLPVTARPDTIIDLADQLERDELLTLVQAQSYRRRLLPAQIAQRARFGRVGTPRLHSVLLTLQSGIDSVLHEKGVGMLMKAGLPKPECGIELVRGAGESDCVIRRPGAKRPPYGFCVEWDGLHHLLEPEQAKHDRRKDRMTHASGYTPTFRGTWADIEHPQELRDACLAEYQRYLEMDDPDAA